MTILQNLFKEGKSIFNGGEIVSFVSYYPLATRMVPNQCAVLDKSKARSITGPDALES
jgi:hypothetical protein